MDASFLFNILQKARQARDLLMAQGPATLRSAADIVDGVSAIIRQAADYIDQVGPLVQFQAGGGVNVPLPDQGKSYVQELVALRAELLAELEKTEAEAAVHEDELERQAGAGVQQGIFGWIKNIDPNTKATLLNLLVSILTKVVTQSGAAALLAPKATKKHGKKG